IFKIPYSYSIHGLDYPNKGILNLDMKIVAKNATVTFAKSNTILNYMKNRYDLKKVIFLPNSIDANRYYSIEKEEEKILMIEKLGLDSIIKQNDFIITYVGHMILPQKVDGMIDFLKAFQQFLSKLDNENLRERIKLLYVGDGPHSIRLKEKIREFNLTNNVFLLGHRNDVKEILSISDLFTLTSYVEGFPMAILEAMASRVPCLCTNTGEIKNIIGDTGYLINPGDILGMEKAIKDFIFIPDKKKKELKIKARERILKLFDVNQVVNKLLRQVIKANKRKIKICIFSFHGFSLYVKNLENPFGGAEIQLFLLSQELAKNKKFQIDVITSDQKYFKKIIKKDDVKIHVCLPNKKNIKNYISALINLSLTLIKINPDVIIQRAAGIPTLLLAIYCKIRKKKFIYSIASTMDVTKNGVRGIVGKLFHLGMDNASCIITQNKEQINLLQQFKKRKFDNIKIIKNAFSIKNNIMLEKKNGILWIARADRIKRPELFIELARQFPNERFTMICPISDDKHFWKTIREKAIKIPNINFIEMVPFNQIEEYFEKAKIFVNTSRLEGFPNTFIQAFKNYTPVISLEVDPDNLFEKFKCGINCNGNFDYMVSKIKVLLENDNVYKEFANNAFKYVKNNHDIKKIVKEWIKVIEKLVRTKN
ncbi:MAG: glycosyltransferase family 4 protein, partial [Promethearchaeota archaeon]